METQLFLKLAEGMIGNTGQFVVEIEQTMGKTLRK